MKSVNLQSIKESDKISEGIKSKIDRMCENGEINPLKYDYKFLYWDEYDKEKKENTSTNKGKPRKNSKKK